MGLNLNINTLSILIESLGINFIWSASVDERPMSQITKEETDTLSEVILLKGSLLARPEPTRHQHGTIQRTWKMHLLLRLQGKSISNSETLPEPQAGHLPGCCWRGGQFLQPEVRQMISFKSIAQNLDLPSNWNSVPLSSMRHEEWILPIF